MANTKSTMPASIDENAVDNVSATSVKFTGGLYCLPTVFDKYCSNVGLQAVRKASSDPRGTPPMTIAPFAD